MHWRLRSQNKVVVVAAADAAVIVVVVVVVLTEFRSLLTDGAYVLHSKGTIL